MGYGNGTGDGLREWNRGVWYGNGTGVCGMGIEQDEWGMGMERENGVTDGTCIGNTYVVSYLFQMFPMW